MYRRSVVAIVGSFVVGRLVLVKGVSVGFFVVAFVLSPSVVAFVIGPSVGFDVVFDCVVVLGFSVGSLVGGRTATEEDITVDVEGLGSMDIVGVVDD